MDRLDIKAIKARISDKLSEVIIVCPECKIKIMELILTDIPMLIEYIEHLKNQIAEFIYGEDMGGIDRP